ncbi:MAG: hypothetical protein EXR37_02685, partial [Limnohabitans sp.]|nr:hypothetical protein [Limnohabitans sp.]
MSQLLGQLQWRYATKKMDLSRTVLQDKLDQITEAARLAPSPSCLQPYELIVVSNEAKRARICKMSYDQSQVADCSHLLVFATWDNYTAERINHMFDLNIAMRDGTNDGWEKYRQRLLKEYPARNPQVNFDHAARQAYIALGILCKSHRISHPQAYFKRYRQMKQTTFANTGFELVTKRTRKRDFLEEM